jgi:hypothetical protein
MRSRLLVTAICLLAAMPTFAEEASYLVSGGDLPVAAASNGFAQDVQVEAAGVVRVRVATSISPIGATGSYGEVLAGARPEVPIGFELPNRLRSRLRPDIDAWQAATLIIEWAADNIRVDVNDDDPQDAIAVIDRGRGRCSGIANATVALLKAAGFDAHTVSGLLIGDNELIPHRWLECHLPGAGWVASDPTLGLWTITPRHLVFANTVVNLPRVDVITVTDGDLERLPRRKGRLVRPNRGADLVCRLPASSSRDGSVAVLRGLGGEVRRARFDPEARFSDLLPGPWTLEIESGGVVVERRRLKLRSGDFRSFMVEDEIDGQGERLIP